MDFFGRTFFFEEFNKFVREKPQEFDPPAGGNDF
jgi:hypothetical protein